MAAPRTTSIRALRALSKQTSPNHAHLSQQTRSLRLTAPVEASPYLGVSAVKPSLSRALDEAHTQRTAKAARHANGQGPRQFNTSRALKAVGDSSTIDFAYLPDFTPDSTAKPVVALRVPLLPDSVYPQSTRLRYTEEEQEDAVMRPLISTASGDSHASPLADVVDNTAIDFHGLSDAVAATAAEGAEGAEGGELRRLFSGLVDDILGPKRAVGAV